MTNNKIAVIVLSLVCLICYSGSLSNGFVFDDSALIVNNPILKVKGFPLNAFKTHIYAHWTGNPSFSLMYRPLQVLTYWLDYKVWGLKPLGYHLTNLILHLLSGILLYFLLAGLFSGKTTAFFTAALFLSHPLNLPVVSYVSGRADILSFLFMLASGIFFLKGRYILSLLAAALALLSRENALLIFLSITLLILFQKREKKDYLRVLPFIFLSFVYLVMRFLIFGVSALAVHNQQLALPVRAINCLSVTFEYLRMTLFPFNLHFFRSAPLISSFLSKGALAILVLTLIAAYLVYRYRKNKTVIFGLSWFLIGLIPAYFMFDGFQKFNNQALVAESWVYPALAGILLVLTQVLLSLKRPGVFILAALVLFFSALTVWNNAATWKNAVSFDRNTLKYLPENTPFRRMLIEDSLEAGDFALADKEINKLASFYGEDNILVIIERGGYYFYRKDAKSAIECYNKVLIKSFISAYRTAACYKMLGDLDSARNFAQASFALNPDYEPNNALLKELNK